MSERTKGTLVFDGLPPGTHTWWERKDAQGRALGVEPIERGARLENVDLERNPELRGPLSTGAARWDDEPRPRKQEK